MLSEMQKAEFWERGVIVLETALSAEELEPLRRQHRSWIDESRQHDGPFGEMLDGRPRFDVEPGHSKKKPALRRVAVARRNFGRLPESFEKRADTRSGGGFAG